MRVARIAVLMTISTLAVTACGGSEKGDGGAGFSQRDLEAARQFSRVKAESPSLESLADGLTYALTHDTRHRSRTTLKRLRRAAERFRSVVPKFDDPRARRAMRAFADASSEVAATYGEIVHLIARREPATRAYVLIRELVTAVDETDAADRRLRNLEPSG